MAKPCLNKIIKCSYEAALILLFLYLTGLILLYPSYAIHYARTGLEIWMHQLLPTLLPFMILSGILVDQNLASKLVSIVQPLFRFLFHCSPYSTYCIIIGFLCGFPMGARTVAQFYDKGLLKEKEASVLLSFCNNLGPVFFINYAIPRLSTDKTLSAIILMYGIPFLYGMLRFHLLYFKEKSTMHHHPQISMATQSNTNKNNSLLHSVNSSIVSSLIGISKLGGYMILFNVLNLMFLPFHHLSSDVLTFFQCLLEISGGLDFDRAFFNRTLLLCFLPLGGLSCIAQTYAMIENTSLSITNYTLHKLFQTLIMTILVLLFCTNGFI